MVFIEEPDRQRPGVGLRAREGITGSPLGTPHVALERGPEDRDPVSHSVHPRFHHSLSVGPVAACRARPLRASHLRPGGHARRHTGRRGRPGRRPRRRPRGGLVHVFPQVVQGGARTCNGRRILPPKLAWGAGRRRPFLGGVGRRRRGFKIPRPLPGLRVRVPPSAPRTGPWRPFVRAGADRARSAVSARSGEVVQGSGARTSNIPPNRLSARGTQVAPHASCRVRPGGSAAPR